MCVLKRGTQKAIKQANMKYEKNNLGEFVCIYCGITKRRQNTMRYHQLNHENELNHNCTICSKSFLQKQTLDMHMKSKHSENDAKIEKFACPFDNCTFSSLSKGNATIHCHRIHCQEEIKEIVEPNIEEKTIRCNACEKTFPSSCGFYYHVGACLKKMAESDVKTDLAKKLERIASIRKESTPE